MVSSRAVDSPISFEESAVTNHCTEIRIALEETEERVVDHYGARSRADREHLLETIKVWASKEMKDM